MNRSVVVNLIANVAQWNRGLQNASKAMTDVTTKNKQQVNELSTKIGVLGGTMATFAGMAVKKFMDFDAAMSSVSAATNESADNMKLLRAAAIKAGADSVYSATEAAEAIEALGKAGVSTKNILGGALKGAMDLAASEGMDLADAADLTATAMSQFGLSGERASHVADLLAAGAGKAQGSAADLGMALKQGGLVANQFGISIEQTTGALALFAQKGLIGSDAGTSLKSMLTALANPSKESARMMADLGISVYDTSGKFIGLDGLAGQLHDKLSGLSDATRQQALAQIFGTDAMRAASVLYESGAEGVREMTDAVNENGYASEAAAKRLDNLKGDLEAMSGAFETLLIGMGEGADGPLRALVQGITDIINKFNEMPAGVKQAILLIAGAGGLGMVGFAAVSKITMGLAGTMDAMKSLGIISDTTAGKMVTGFGKVAKAAGALVVVATALNAISTAGNDASISAANLKQRLDALGDSDGPDAVASFFSDLGAMDGGMFRFKDGAEQFSEALATIQRGGFDKWVQNFNQTMANATNLWGEDSIKVGEYESRLRDVGDQLASIASTDLPTVTDAFAKLAGATDGSAESHVNLLNAMPGLKNALFDIAEGAGLATDDASLLRIALGEVVPVMDDAASATEGVTDATADQTDALMANVEALQNAAQAQRDLTDANIAASNASIGYEASIDNAREALEKAAGVTDKMYDSQGNLTAQGQALVDAFVSSGAALDITTEAGRNVRGALDDVASAGLGVVDAMKKQGATGDELRAKMQTVRDDFIQTATQAGMTEDAARALADQYGLVPETVKTDVELTGVAAAQQALNDFRNQVISLDGKTATVTLFQKVISGGDPTKVPGYGTVLRNAYGGPVAGFASDSIPPIHPAAHSLEG